MPMITIADDHNRKIMLTIDEKCIISVDCNNLDENGEKRTEWHLTIEVPHQGCSALFFNSTKSMQKVWDRLCEITGAKDIFDVMPDAYEKLITHPVPKCDICGKNQARIFEIDKNSVMRNYCRDCVDMIHPPAPRIDRHSIVDKY